MVVLVRQNPCAIKPSPDDDKKSAPRFRNGGGVGGADG